MTIRTVALRAAVALGIVLLAVILWQMREAAQLLAIAIAVAAGLAPLVKRLTNRGMPRTRAAALIFGGSLLLLILVGGAFGLLLLGDLAQLIDNAPIWYILAGDWLLAQGGWAAALAEQLPSSTDLSTWLMGAESFDAALIALVVRLITVIALAIGAATLGFYWLLDQPRIARLWLSLLPLVTRTRVRATSEAVYREVGIYVRGVAAMALLTTVLLLIVYEVAAVPGGAALALLGGLAQVVPLLGPTLAVLPGTLVALGQGEFTALGVFAGSLAAVALLRYAVAPHLLRRGIGVNPVLVVVLIMALAELGGLPMILLAPPLAAALQAGTRALMEKSRGEATLTQATRVDELERRLDEVAATAEANPDDRRLQSLVGRARALLEEARGVV